MPRELPQLTGSQRLHIAETLDVWAHYHPHPDLPIIQLADGSELTPRDMAVAAGAPDSRRGQLLYRVFAAGLLEDEVEPPENLDEILQDYLADINLWRTHSSTSF